MMLSGSKLDKASALAAAGHHAGVVSYLDAWPDAELEQSPVLSLAYGTAQARLGRHDEGMRWVDRAIDAARLQDDGPTETRALNTRGAVALAGGNVDEGADYFTQALLAASRDGDHAIIGRCSNNLGIINNVRGRYAEALGSYAMAIAAFERAGSRRGVAEAHHNLAITYTEQGKLDRAFREATLANDEAKVAGDEALVAMTARGRAEIRMYSGELDSARHEIEGSLKAHRKLGDAVEEAEDLRIAASILAANGEIEAAESMLRDVVARAVSQRRPLLVAEATRDLAYLFRDAGRAAEALEAARGAILGFERLGAESEIRKLDSQEWGYPLATELSKALAPLHEAQQLADAGRFAELVTYLNARPPSDLERSPTLALLCGIGHARLGHLDEGQQWVTIAIARARATADRILEVRALNVYGAIALERGGIDEARGFFMRAQAEAMRDGDMATVGRCANNLGIVANMEGDYPQAVGAYTTAIAAYQRAGADRGVAESRHNLGVTYRSHGNLSEAMQAADEAVREAEQLGDTALMAQAVAGRAEIRVAAHDPELAIREAERALALHRELGDSVLESEDMRILAGALAAAGEVAQAEEMLRDVVQRATDHARPLLVATTQRDLAYLLGRIGPLSEARELGGQARDNFESLGAKKEVENLTAFLADPDRSLG